MKCEDAVAPVIAAMLVLAVIVTFFAVWNASAVPSMKAQAEVSHLHDVEEGILRFSSDISLAATISSASSGMIPSSSMFLTERIPLGGGDILYSATKSGGVLSVESEDEPYMRIQFYNFTSPAIPEVNGNRTFILSNISYQPVGNFWQDQGYSWSHGTVNVTKGQISVPLEYPSMQEVPYNITRGLFSADVGAYGSDPGTCSVIVIKGVNILPSGTGRTLSGNGIGTLTLNSQVATDTFVNITKINVSVIRPSSGSTSGFPRAMYRAVNDSLTNTLKPACSNIKNVAYSDGTVTLTIGVPNVTVIQRTTNLTLGTQ
jgi:hypothetical protein